MKAMLLAAGRGERLRPLTDALPKALVEAGGKPLLAWHLERLARAGFREAVINVSHLGGRIIERVGDGARFGLRVQYSRESERLGDSAGGLQPLALARILHAQVKARAVADALHDAFAEMRNVDHRLAEAGACQALEVPGDERLAAGLDQRFRHRVGERPQPLAAARGEEHGLHSSSSSSRASGASSRYLCETERA